jgi:hypothetical protein
MEQVVEKLDKIVDLNHAALMIVMGQDDKVDEFYQKKLSGMNQ